VLVQHAAIADILTALGLSEPGSATRDDPGTEGGTKCPAD
jgi:hypothetical protein